MAVPNDILRARAVFLIHYPPAHHAEALDLLCKAARKALRAGVLTPQAVSGVLAGLCRKHGSDLGGLYDTTRRLLWQHPEAIRAGAKWGLWWESLTPRERKALNRENLERVMPEVGDA